MSCDRYTDAIVDHACGADLADGCRGAPARLRGVPPDIRGAAAAAPGPRLRPARGAGNRAVRLVRGANIGGPRALADSSSARVLVDRRRRSGSRDHPGTLVAIRSGDHRPTDRQEAAGRPVAPPAAVVEHVPSSGAPAVADQPTAHRSRVEPRGVASARRSRRVSSRATRKPDVAVVTTQAQAIARYLALVREGAIDSSALADPNTIAIAAPDDLVIAPISVEALPVRNVERGTGPGVE